MTSCWNLPTGHQLLEQQEQLEQLRVLENGYSILCVESPVDSIGVDVPEDLTHVAQLIATGMIPD